MRYRQLGRTGLRLSEFALGTGTFGTGWGWGADPATSRRILETFAEAGGNLLDCADVYQAGESEQILGDLVRPDRDRWILTTKYTAAGDASIARSGNNRKHMSRPSTRVCGAWAPTTSTSSSRTSGTG